MSAASPPRVAEALGVPWEPTEVEAALDASLEHLDRDEPREVGRYSLCRRLADGGMGTVYLARLEGPGGFERAVAIKRIHPHLARRQDLIEMFLDEARLTARIHHPNVAQVVDFGEVDGSHFLAMEYLLGESLAALGARMASATPLPTERWVDGVARILADASEGLHAAHELADDDGAPLGVVHRDVSPQNIFVTYDGSVKVLDFGVALARGRLHETMEGSLKGKVAYMPPEQLAGEPLDRRADVWSLGVCAWEALTGRRLFRRDNDLDTLTALSTSTLVPPSRWCEAVTAELDDVVMGALVRDPRTRTASARDFGQALERYLHGRPGVTGRAAIQGLMGALFEKRGAEKAEVVRTALLERPVAAQKLAVGEASAATPSGVSLDGAPAPLRGGVGRETVSAPRLEAPPALVLSDTVIDEVGGEQIDTVLDAAPRQRSRVGPILALLAVIVVFVIGGFGIGLLVRGADGRAERSAPTRLPAAQPLPRGAEPAPIDAPDPAPAPIDPPAAEPPPGEPPPEPTPPRTEPPRERRGRRARRAAVPVGRGFVSIATRGGWADVYVAGSRRGRTPTRLELPAGRHTLELRPFGRPPARRVSVTVAAGETERVSVQVAR